MSDNILDTICNKSNLSQGLKDSCSCRESAAKVAAVLDQFRDQQKERNEQYNKYLENKNKYTESKNKWDATRNSFLNDLKSYTKEKWCTSNWYGDAACRELGGDDFVFANDGTQCCAFYDRNNPKNYWLDSKLKKHNQDKECTKSGRKSMCKWAPHYIDKKLAEWEQQNVQPTLPTEPRELTLPSPLPDVQCCAHILTLSNTDMNENAKIMQQCNQEINKQIMHNYQPQATIQLPQATTKSIYINDESLPPGITTCKNIPPPQVTTPPPQVTTPPPQVTTPPPQVTTPPPQVTTPPPQVTTPPPQVTTPPPQATTQPPQATTSPPQATTQPPQATTSPPQANKNLWKIILGVLGFVLLIIVGGIVVYYNSKKTKSMTDNNQI